MRRKDREITDKNEILSIIKKCDVCDVAFFDEEYPYIVPLNFGVIFENNKFTLFFHGANAGTKLKLLKSNNHVAFSMNCSHKLLLCNKPCDSTMEYDSVCGSGIIEVLEQNEKVEALSAIMNQYDNKDKYVFSNDQLQLIMVLKLSVVNISAKRLKK